MKRFVLLCLAVFCVLGLPLLAQEGEGRESGGPAVEAASPGYAQNLRYFAAAIAVGVGCVAGSIAVAQIGSAAMGAMSENPEVSGKALPFVGLAEGICLWGFLVALLILIL
jgi:V/A-type H+-transporting ATPase subunit K